MSDNLDEMYPDYRLQITLDIVKLMTIGESFRIQGESGMGKSKYLRYLSSSSYINENYLKSNNLIVFYIDLNKAYKQTSENILEIIAKTMKAKGTEMHDIESRLNEIAENKNRIYLLFDHGEVLNSYEEQPLRLLKAIRSANKSYLSYALSYDKNQKPEQDKIDCLLGTANLIVEIGPIDKEESIQNIKFFSEKLNLNLDNVDIEQIADYSEGVPKNLRKILMHLTAGKTLDEAMNTSDYTNFSEKQTLDNAKKSMTKSEFQVFTTLHTNKGKVVSRDDLANILNPEMNGDGVSNESIDQLVSRVRKAVAKAELPIDIMTKRGVGYYIE